MWSTIYGLLISFFLIFIIVFSLVSGQMPTFSLSFFDLPIREKDWKFEIVYFAFGSDEVAQNNKSLMALFTI